VIKINDMLGAAFEAIEMEDRESSVDKLLDTNLLFNLFIFSFIRFSILSPNLHVSFFFSGLLLRPFAIGG
jgi:hypothetical protein